MAESRNWRVACIAVGIALVAIAIRFLLLYHERSEAAKPAQPAARPLSSDAYVVRQKVYAYDLKSARVLVGKPVWVRAGYGVAYYPYNPSRHRADFAHEAGLLAPIERLEITAVFEQKTPGEAQWQRPPGAAFRLHLDRKAVLGTFSQEGKDYAFPIGSVQNGDYHFLIDELLFIQDPHQLYAAWPGDVWRTIAAHQVKPGMNETQVSFAIGVPESASQTNDSGQRTVQYANHGHPLSVTFENGRAVNVGPGPPAQSADAR